MLNSYLAKPEIVEILLDNPKAHVLLNPATRAIVKWFGALSLACFGYPPSVAARFRAHDIFRMMSPILEGSLVDVGCAFGAAHTFEFARRLAPHPVLGLDLDPVSIDVARRLNQVLRFDNLSFEVGDIADMHLHRRFDIVFTAETLEHLKDDVAAVKTLTRMVEPTGRLVISVPYCENPVEFDAPESAFNAPPESSHLFPGGYHWRSGYDEVRLRALLDACGFEIVSVEYTRSVRVLPEHLLLFPVNYLMSSLVNPFLGVIININVIARPVGREPVRKLG